MMSSRQLLILAMFVFAVCSQVNAKPQMGMGMYPNGYGNPGGRMVEERRTRVVQQQPGYGGYPGGEVVQSSQTFSQSNGNGGGMMEERQVTQMVRQRGGRYRRSSTSVQTTDNRG